MLTAIRVDAPNDGTITRTFEQDEPLLEFLNRYGGDCNIYFTVNNVDLPTNIKPQKKNIRSSEWFYVDVDPVMTPKELDAPMKKAFIENEQNRIKTMFLENKDTPRPTLMIFSGGGYQAFWKIRKPFEIDGKEEKWLSYERYNQKLQDVFKGDHCFNVDRIMRLPGTINRPPRKKREQGRENALAEVVHFESFLKYPISDFIQHAEVQSNYGGFSADRVKISGNIKKFETIEEISPQLTLSRAGVVINQGYDPENQEKHGSRSEWLFYACCEMVRAGCDDDTIFSVITDPGWGISASVLDQGRRAEKYAIRQIERARDAAIDVDLAEMNQKYAVIQNLGGRCLIVEEMYEPSLNRSYTSEQDFTNFKNAYCNQYKTVGQSKNGEDKKMAKGAWWIQHPNRRQYKAMTFIPCKDVPGYYNLWKGWAYEARSTGSCDLFLKHIHDNICSKNTEHFNYLLGWMATMIQQPTKPGRTAIVFRGRKGSGKSFVASRLGKLCGQHYVYISNREHLVGKFNHHLQDCLFLFADEAFFAGDKTNESVLKSLITEPTIAIERKFGSMMNVANYLHIMMASNEDWVVPASGDERRYFVLDVASDQLQKSDYFGKIDHQMEKEGGYEALLDFLMNYDLSDFNVWDVPKTQALQSQKELSMDSITMWWYEKLRDGIVLQDRPNFEDDYLIKLLMHDFKEHSQELGRSYKNWTNSVTFGKFMKRVLPIENNKKQAAGMIKVKIGDKTKEFNRPYYYVVPSLEECRKQFDKEFGGPFEWPKESPSLKMEMPF